MLDRKNWHAYVMTAMSCVGYMKSWIGETFARARQCLAENKGESQMGLFPLCEIRANRARTAVGTSYL